MNREVWKYEIHVARGVTPFPMPLPLKVLTALRSTSHPDYLTFWVEVDTEAEQISKNFCVFMTGETIPGGFEHRATVRFDHVDDFFVAHLYEMVG